MVKAIKARRAGDQTAGIVLVDDVYYYDKESPKREKKKVEIPNELKTLGKVLRDKMKPVAEIYGTLKEKHDQKNEQAIEGIVNGVLRKKLGLSENDA